MATSVPSRDSFVPVAAQPPPALIIGKEPPHTARRVALSMDLADLIDVRAGVRSGKPCFVGTRIAVYDVLEYLAGGMTAEQIVDDFPELTVDHVRAALHFAALRERRLAASA